MAMAALAGCMRHSFGSTASSRCLEHKALGTLQQCGGLSSLGPYSYGPLRSIAWSNPHCKLPAIASILYGVYARIGSAAVLKRTLTCV